MFVDATLTWIWFVGAPGKPPWLFGWNCFSFLRSIQPLPLWCCGLIMVSGSKCLCQYGTETQMATDHLLALWHRFTSICWEQQDRWDPTWAIPLRGVKIIPSWALRVKLFVHPFPCLWLPKHSGKSVFYLMYLKCFQGASTTRQKKVLFVWVFISGWQVFTNANGSKSSNWLWSKHWPRNASYNGCCSASRTTLLT